MTGFSLLFRTKGVPTAVAARWVAALAAEAEALHTLDDELRPMTDDAAAMTRAREVLEAWGEWVKQADSLLHLLRPVASVGLPYLQGLHDLEIEIAAARSTLAIGPETWARRVRQMKDRDVVDLQELRRGLRAGTAARHAS